MRSIDQVGLAAELLERGLGVRVQARGYSMTPWILDGDVLDIEPLNGAAWRAGDILLCRRGEDRFVCHRLIRRLSRGGIPHVVLKGDWLLAPDRPIPADRCLGRIRSVERQGTRVLHLDATRPWAALLARLAALASLFAPAFVPLARGYLTLRAPKGRP
ncbi:MAG: S24/S26 family peptidase [Planctomycetes bacterium]|nr:S24/S26 family peptidase [Planctomycetota bacterium]